MTPTADTLATAFGLVAVGAALLKFDTALGYALGGVFYLLLALCIYAATKHSTDEEIAPSLRDRQDW